MNRTIVSSAIVVLLLFAAGPDPVRADPESIEIEGHWNGTVKVGPSLLEYDIDFERRDGRWSGDISIPTQGLRDLPLDAIAIDGDRIDFQVAGLPGMPSFRGKVSADGRTMQGTFTQGGKSAEFRLVRDTDPSAALRRSLQGFDAVVNKAMRDFQVPGLAIAIVKDRGVIYARGFGRRDVGKDLPVTSKTLFPIGSCTKAFTTFVMGTMVDEGTLDWDVPLRTYLPGLRMSDPIATESITLRDLVTHRSGLPRHDLAWYNTQLTGKDVFERLPHFEASEPLRSKFQYNNMMYLLAGFLVETLDGRAWDESVRARIFGPLKMTRSNVSVAASQESDDFARPYREQDGKIAAIPFRDITSVGPAGSINSCVEEMARWMVVHLRGGRYDGQALISPSTLDDLHAPQIPTGALFGPSPRHRHEISPASYALGWATDTYRGHRRVHHGGAVDGFVAETCLFPDDDLGLVVLTNLDGTPLPSTIAQHAADRLLNLEPIDWLAEAIDRRQRRRKTVSGATRRKKSVRRPGTKPAHPLEEYAGDYEHPGYGVLAVELRDGKLSAAYHGIMLSLGHWHFEVFNARAQNDPALAANELKCQFRTNLDGQVEAVAVPLEPKVSPIVFTRVPDRKLRDPDYLQRFTGIYDLDGQGQTATIRLRGHVLTYQQSGCHAVELIPVRDAVFAFKKLAGKSIHFHDGDDGRVTEMSLHTDGGVFTARRRP